MSEKSSRRDFLKKTTAVTAGLALTSKGISAKSYKKILGSNDRINVVIVGTGDRYKGYIDGIADKNNNTELISIYDVSDVSLESAKKYCFDILGYNPKPGKDFRKALNDKKVDAVCISTPDHWHTPGAIMSMQADKHVYVEKPCSHNMHENELIVTAQKKYNKVVQMGNQQRSTPNAIRLIEKIHNGIIGEPYKAVAFYSNQRPELQIPKVKAAPSGLNWDLFQGPVPRSNYLEGVEHYLWHWYNWDYGTAEAGNNGTHELDIARWALKVDYPERVEVEAAKNHFKDDGWSMYDTMYASYKYANGKELVWDGKSRNGYNTYQSARGTLIYGSNGAAWTNQGAYKIYNRIGEIIEQGEPIEQLTGTNTVGSGAASTRHINNFFDAIRGKATLNSPIDDAAISTALTHYANIAYRSGKDFDVDAKTGRIYDREAMSFWKREYEPGWDLTL